MLEDDDDEGHDNPTVEDVVGGTVHCLATRSQLTHTYRDLRALIGDVRADMARVPRGLGLPTVSAAEVDRALVELEQMGLISLEPPYVDDPNNLAGFTREHDGRFVVYAVWHGDPLSAEGLANYAAAEQAATVNKRKRKRRR